MTTSRTGTYQPNPSLTRRINLQLPSLLYIHNTDYWQCPNQRMSLSLSPYFSVLLSGITHPQWRYRSHRSGRHGKFSHLQTAYNLTPDPLPRQGQNLILNINDKGFNVVAYNRTTSKVDDFLANEAKGQLFPPLCFHLMI